MPKVNVPIPEARLKALQIAASVFSQLDYTHTVNEIFSGRTSLDPDEDPPTPKEIEPFAWHEARTLKDFRESVDAVFKAAGLEKVEWE